MPAKELWLKRKDERAPLGDLVTQFPPLFPVVSTGLVFHPA